MWLLLCERVHLYWWTLKQLSPDSHSLTAQPLSARCFAFSPCDFTILVLLWHEEENWCTERSYERRLTSVLCSHDKQSRPTRRPRVKGFHWLSDTEVHLQSNDYPAEAHPPNQIKICTVYADNECLFLKGQGWPCCSFHLKLVVKVKKGKKTQVCLPEKVLFSVNSCTCVIRIW